MIIDIFFVLFLLLGIITGARKGFIHSIFSFVAFLAGIIAGLKYTDEFSLWLHDFLNIHSKYLPFIAFGLIFIVVVILLNLLSRLIEKVVNILMLGFFNRLGGVIFWSLIYVLGFSILLWFLNQVHFISPEAKVESQVYFYIEPFAPIAFSLMAKLFPFMEGLFDSIENSFEEMANHKETITALL